MPAQRGHSGGCTVCAHPERVRLEILLASGAGQSAVGRKYGLSADAVHRHWRNHVTAERKANLILGPVQRAELAARVCEETGSVLDHLKAIRAGLYQQYNAAIEAGDRNSGALLAGKLHENLRTVARITGELTSSPLVQINNSQTNVIALLDSREFATFQATLIRVLNRFPAARDAVVAEFEALEKQGAAAPLPVPVLEHEHVEV